MFKPKPWYQPLEHMAIGAAIALSILLAGAAWPPALVGSLWVAGFKEGTDAWNGADPIGSAILDALEIVAGAGACIAVAILLW